MLRFIGQEKSVVQRKESLKNIVRNQPAVLQKMNGLPSRFISSWD